MDIPFVSAHGVSGSLHIVTEDKPINGIRLNQEDKEVVAGSSVSLSATILPMTAKNLYTAEITSGSEFATLTGNAADGYTLQVKEDAAAGSKIVVTFTSIQSKADGSKAVASNTFTVKAKSTEGATLNLKGTWEDDGYPASAIVFKEDKTGTVVYYDSMMTAYYYKFTWNNATADSLADEGSFVELDDEEGNEVDWGSFTLSSFKLVGSQVVLQFDGEDPKTFTKTFSVSDLGGGITY